MTAVLTVRYVDHTPEELSDQQRTCPPRRSTQMQYTTSAREVSIWTSVMASLAPQTKP
jgi:hypothetical protein